MEYQEFLSSKRPRVERAGFKCNEDLLHSSLFDYQREIVKWACERGRSAVFADCGLGKSRIQIEFAYQAADLLCGAALIVTPLAVAEQTLREATSIGRLARISRDGSIVKGVLNITNYAQLHKFDPREIVCVVLDESSILKSQDGKTKQRMIEMFGDVPFRMACTATPAPNDHEELGNHAEFLGICRRVEMLSRFFVHDAEQTQDWRLKGHAVDDFWRWVSSWSVMARSPADLGFSGDNFKLPKLIEHKHNVDADIKIDGMLFPLAMTLSDRRDVRRQSMTARCQQIADMVNASNEPWIVWGELNNECDSLEELIDDAIQVSGSDDDTEKTTKLNMFSDGKARVLVTKPKVAGFGMNWQHCRNMAFVGLTDSYEQYYQAVRRCYRFGQTKEVNVHIFATGAEQTVLNNMQRKEQQAETMTKEMVKHAMASWNKPIERDTETAQSVLTDRYDIRNGDCIEQIKTLADESIGYSVFSPPFASLYTYSDSERDMGNCKDAGEFLLHFDYLASQLFRVMQSGRNVSMHCMLLPTSKTHDGFIGLRDFRGDLIQSMIKAGFVYHSEVVIWKDPVTAMQRTKAIGLLHKQLKKDSCMSRQGVPDYLCTFRKPGINVNPVTHTNETFPVEVWQRYASPVWMDINQSDTLQKESAREEKDEKHICPLQLEVIKRGLFLWSNPGDVVLSPFMGIGSEGYVSVKNNRKFVGFELKRSYFEQAKANLHNATSVQMDLL